MTGDVDRNLLDDVFGKSEEQIETFVEAISDAITDPNKDDIDKIKSGEPDKISAPEFIDQTSGFIRVSHGWHDADYVWHIAPNHIKKPFKISAERVVYGIAKVMNEVIPQDCEVKIWLPYADWDIQEYTFKAMDLRSHWQVSEEAIGKMNLNLFELLNTMV